MPLLFALRAQGQGIPHHLLPRRKSGKDDRMTISQLPALNLCHSKLTLCNWYEYPVAVMQVQHSATRDHGVGLTVQPVKRGGDKHASTHHAGICYFDSNFSRAGITIEDLSYVADAAVKNTAWIGVQFHVRCVTEAHGREVIFINITDDPDSRKIRNGEEVWLVVRSTNARGLRDVLLNDRTRYRRMDADDGV